VVVHFKLNDQKSMKTFESRLLRHSSSVGQYSAQDLAEITFLSLITLHLLRCNFSTAPWAKNYAAKSRASAWRVSNSSFTDLYQMLHVIVSQPRSWTSELKNSSASETLLNDIQLQPADLNLFLRNISGNSFDPNISKRLLLKFEYGLRITVTNYKSVRRIAGDWFASHVDEEAKKLAVTRLLQALRHKARRVDLLRPLERMSSDLKLELQNVCDPETGAGCDTTATTAAQTSRQPSLLKQLAVGAGLGVGAYLLGKALFK
jgi:hypothetical protein